MTDRDPEAPVTSEGQLTDRSAIPSPRPAPLNRSSDFWSVLPYLEERFREGTGEWTIGRGASTGLDVVTDHSVEINQIGRGVQPIRFPRLGGPCQGQLAIGRIADHICDLEGGSSIPHLGMAGDFPVAFAYEASATVPYVMATTSRRSSTSASHSLPTSCCSSSAMRSTTVRSYTSTVWKPPASTCPAEPSPPRPRPARASKPAPRSLPRCFRARSAKSAGWRCVIAL